MRREIVTSVKRWHSGSNGHRIAFTNAVMIIAVKSNGLTSPSLSLRLFLSFFFLAVCFFGAMKPMNGTCQVDNVNNVNNDDNRHGFLLGHQLPRFSVLRLRAPL